MAENKKQKIRYDWIGIILIWFLRLLNLLYANALRWMLYFFLVLTPTLYAPREYLAILSLGMFETPIPLSDTTITSWMASDAAGRCMTTTQKRDAVSADVDNVSGWYGPGAYLSWLVTGYVAACSSIWGSKISAHNPHSRRLDGEVLFTLAYPMIATFDILARLITCKIDPGINAALFVLISSIMIVSPLSRLSWQWDGEAVDTESILPKCTRGWWMSGVRFVMHTVLYAILGEPYGYTDLVLAVYGVLLLIMFASEIHGEVLSETYPYRKTVYLGRAKRLVLFGVVQAVWVVVLAARKGYVWPRTSASLWDLDQVAGLAVTVCALAYSRWDGIKDAVSSSWKFVETRSLMGRLSH
ncbi:uncharacterized protein BO97DRAFT_423552 [Aspergillus homomorphus CBS 101889]|uniref:Uncharacterized protein n=1 Tax=Aspergillus homomorphus (strain CBS 101889) TaxID=1450537 RepID=A0A395I157_ASPHC|nr:hypothetical protein BO97DRAFT_423552 [Aspergillus homomorphus CBS 101889]RAL13343.1 hypothetical protein BO97DRAFT_423552 [Aspergillus homomorphus CBS 101889]